VIEQGQNKADEFSSLKKGKSGGKELKHLEFKKNLRKGGAKGMWNYDKQNSIIVFG